MHTTVDLAYYKSISQYKPLVGDFIICHGWIFKRWIGIVRNINTDGTITIAKAGLPVLLLTMSQAKMDKRSTDIDIEDIRVTKSGKYAILQITPDGGVWYV